MYECGTELVNWIELASAWSTEDESTRRLISDQVVKDFIRIWECDGNTLDELESLRLRIDLFDVLSSISATGQLFSEWLAIIEERLLTPELQEKLNMWRPDDVDELNSLKKLLSRGQQLSGLLVQKFGSYVRRGEIRITTCHSSKGLQAEHVFIWRSSFGDLTAECDKNLLYTAITRAGTGLVVMYQQNSRYIDILSSICNVNA
jgi:superfamily I DNA/RNA helicase